MDSMEEGPDDEEEEDEIGNQLLVEFMFGNVGTDMRLEEDYMDEASRYLCTLPEPIMTATLSAIHSELGSLSGCIFQDVREQLEALGGDVTKFGGDILPMQVCHPCTIFYDWTSATSWHSHASAITVYCLSTNRRTEAAPVTLHQRAMGRARRRHQMQRITATKRI